MKNQEFKDCILKYKNLIIRAVMDKTGDYQAAQEICQQVFAAYYMNMHTIPEDLRKAWLMKCTLNAVVDYHRKQKLISEIFSTVSLGEAANLLVEESLDACEERILTRDLVRRIREDLKQVNKSWYAIFVLHYEEGLSYREMSDKLGVPEQILRARACRARQYIRKKFGEEYKKL